MIGASWSEQTAREWAALEVMQPPSSHGREYPRQEVSLGKSPQIPLGTPGFQCSRRHYTLQQSMSSCLSALHIVQSYATKGL